MVRQGPTWVILLAVWLGSLAIPFFNWPGLVGVNGLAWLSALSLAPGRPQGPKMFKMALTFLVIWGLTMGLASLVQPVSPRQWLNLAAWLALGLNLMLAKTPLELADQARRLLQPILGPTTSQKVALALALLARLIPDLLRSGWRLRTTLNRRAAGLSPIRRLGLWGRALSRTALAQTEDLARTAAKRWPW